jgi:hypothetical protein
VKGVIAGDAALAGKFGEPVRGRGARPSDLQNAGWGLQNVRTEQKIFASADSNIVRTLLENRGNPQVSAARATEILLTILVRSD